MPVATRHGSQGMAGRPTAKSGDFMPVPSDDRANAPQTDSLSQPYESNSVEAALLQHFLDCDIDAKSQSLDSRRGMWNFMLRKAAIVLDNSQMAMQRGLYDPLVARACAKGAELIASRMFPETLDYRNAVTVQPQFSGNEEFTPESLPEINRARIVLQAYLADACLRDGMKWKMQRIEEMARIMGNCYVFPEWRQDYQMLPKTPEEIMAELSNPDMPMDEEVSDIKTVFTRNGPSIKIVDPRNVFIANLWETDGAEALPWITYHQATSLEALSACEMRKGDDGVVHGFYRHLDYVRQFQPTYVPTIYEDVLGTTRTVNNFDFLAEYPRTVGYARKIWVGRFKWSSITIDGKMPTKREQDACLKRYGNDPAACRYAEWWIAELVDTGAANVLVRFQPYPYQFANHPCPFFHVRGDTIEGMTNGQSKYLTLNGKEEICNVLGQGMLDGLLMAMRPPQAFDRDRVDPQWLEDHADNISLSAGDSVPLQPGGRAEQVFQTIMTPAWQAIEPARMGIADLQNAMQETLAMSNTVLGATANAKTAAQDQQSQQNTMDAAAYRAQFLEDTLLSPVFTSWLELFQCYMADYVPVYMSSGAEIQSMRDLDPDIDRQLTEAGYGAREQLRGMYMLTPKDSLTGRFSVRAFGSSFFEAMKQAMALEGLIANAPTLEQFSPGRIKWGRVVEDSLRLRGVRYPAEYWATDAEMEAQQMQQAVAQRMQAMAGNIGGSPTAKRPGQASAPAAKGQASQPGMPA